MGLHRLATGGLLLSLAACCGPPAYCGPPRQVRMGHNDLGLHHLATGNLNEALKCFIRTRDYGTTARHTVRAHPRLRHNGPPRDVCAGGVFFGVLVVWWRARAPALKCFIRTRDCGTTARHTVCGGV